MGDDLDVKERKQKDKIKDHGNDDLDVKERKQKDKIKDNFPEKVKRKEEEEEKVIIKPKDISKLPKSESCTEVENDDLDVKERKQKDKIKDHFPEKVDRKEKADEKIIIKPRDLSKVPKSESDSEVQNDDLDAKEMMQKGKVRDHFPDKVGQKEKEEEKIIIKPKDNFKETKSESEAEVENDNLETKERMQKDKVKDHFPEKVSDHFPEKEKEPKKEEKVI